MSAEQSQRDHFEQLFAQHRGIVLKVAASYTRNAEDRQDLAQDIAAHAWKAFARFDPSRPFSTWLYRVALNVAISSLRGTQTRDRVLVDGSDIELALAADNASDDGDDAVRMLYRCIDRLAPLDRALMLLYLDEKSGREIADVLGISESNVATKIARLKQRIRSELKPTGSDR